jgi:hypothetical protein
MKTCCLLLLLFGSEAKSIIRTRHAIREARDITPQPVYMKIKIRTDHSIVFATLFDNATARDFARLYHCIAKLTICLAGRNMETFLARYRLMQNDKTPTRWEILGIGHPERISHFIIKRIMRPFPARVLS